VFNYVKKSAKEVSALVLGNADEIKDKVSMFSTNVGGKTTAMKTQVSDI
jgi:hypothetical protein